MKISGTAGNNIEAGQTVDLHFNPEDGTYTIAPVTGHVEIVKELKPADWSDRHASTKHILRFFTYNHLPEGLVQNTSRKVTDLVEDLLEVLEDGPELSAGLRKLLEAKDCFVRQAAIDTGKVSGE